jgi:hypothetical protein
VHLAHRLSLSGPAGARRLAARPSRDDGDEDVIHGRGGAIAVLAVAGRKGAPGLSRETATRTKLGGTRKRCSRRPTTIYARTMTGERLLIKCEGCGVSLRSDRRQKHLAKCPALVPRGAAPVRSKPKPDPGINHGGTRLQQRTCGCGGTNESCPRCFGRGYLPGRSNYADHTMSVAKPSSPAFSSVPGAKSDGLSRCGECGKSVRKSQLGQHMSLIHPKTTPHTTPQKLTYPKKQGSHPNPW